MMVRKQAVLDRIEGKWAVLSIEGGQELKVRAEELGAACSEGDAFVLQILPDHEATLEREALARTLLNQLLTDGSTDRAG